MDIEKVKNVLREYIKNNLEVGEDPDFNDDADLFEFGFLDSRGATELMLHIETTFNVEITQKDVTLYSMNTINEIADVIASKF